jgi:dipeptidyl aminopeptidase/acylaminoacyl peptidase
MRPNTIICLLAVLAGACSPAGLANPLAPPAVSVTTQTPLPPSATATNRLTPSPVPPHPLSIDYLRQREYPASEIVIEQTLEPGANYERYIASYQSDGLKIYALLTIPHGEKPESGWPVIVFNHGYIPPDEYRTAERYVAYVDAFARRGYIVFRSDYRGHDRSEGNATSAYRAPDYTVDVLNAVAALKAYPEADTGRIGMWGHSMGGFITLRAMVVDADIKAGVIWAGVVASYADMFTAGQRPRYGSRTVAALYGLPEENPDFWASISANSYLEDLSGPLQLHHGTADPSVLPGFSLTLAEEARAAGQTAELYFYEGDNHNISNSFSAAMLRSIEFFDEYVKGEG